VDDVQARVGAVNRQTQIHTLTKALEGMATMRGKGAACNSIEIRYETT